MTEPYPPEDAKDWSVVLVDIIGHMPQGWRYNQTCREWLEERNIRYYNWYAGEFLIEDATVAVEFRLLFD